MDDLLDNKSTNSNDYLPATVPNATAVLVLGIISIVGCIGYGVPGLICGIIALALHKKDKRLYLSNPEKYDNSFKTSRAGFVCAMIGTILSGLFLLFIIGAIAVGVSSGFSRY